ncbi:hydroxyectoine utilization dehydratase EutB [Salipiger bermudensis]|uniref:hydroxyectoine utilization dehydratase EutB n=1 Tax=Salipiger bermudensis TaxID=344736 RepID=UPI003008CD5C
MAESLPEQPHMADILAAAQRIRGQADATPLLPSALTERLGHPLWLKLETCQPMGAFKLRGALNALAQLPDSTRGVTCCSTGNHGRAVAYAARARGLRAVICMSELVPATKVEGIRALGAEVRLVGRSQDDAQLEATRLVREEGFTDIPPFDHPHVIAGQGTIGLEILQALPDLDTLIIPLSGGGLAAGVALAARTLSPGLRIVGVSMERGAAMQASLEAGRPVPVEEVESLADSLGGGIGLENRHSFALCRALLDDVVLLSEAEIYRAMQALYFEDRLVAEGGAAVGVGALLAGRIATPGRTATIVTGRNVDMGQVTQVVTGQAVTLGDVTVPGQVWR